MCRLQSHLHSNHFAGCAAWPFTSPVRKRVHARPRFCVEFLLGPALELAEDVTPAVRLRAAGLLPALKRAVRLPDDVAALEGLNSALAKLQVLTSGTRSRVMRRAGGLEEQLAKLQIGCVFCVNGRVRCSDDVGALEAPQRRACQAASSSVLDLQAPTSCR